MGLFAGKRPANLGAKNGKLAAVPRSPNAVSSQTDPATDATHYVAPFACNGDPARTWKRLTHLVQALPGVSIVTKGNTYLHAECTSKLLGLVDDFECVLDRRRDVIHVRSAARLGRRDFGVNLARVEKLRTQLGSK